MKLIPNHNIIPIYTHIIYNCMCILHTPDEAANWRSELTSWQSKLTKQDYVLKSQLTNLTKQDHKLSHELTKRDHMRASFLWSQTVEATSWPREDKLTKQDLVWLAGLEKIRLAPAHKSITILKPIAQSFDCNRLYRNL